MRVQAGKYFAPDGEKLFPAVNFFPCAPQSCLEGETFFVAPLCIDEFDNILERITDRPRNYFHARLLGPRDKMCIDHPL